LNNCCGTIDGELSSMTLALKRIVWSDGTSRPDDYNVIHAGQTVGRIYRIRSTGRSSKS
jgi:hypothetical protein